MKTALLVIDPQKIYTDQESEMFCADSTERKGTDEIYIFS